MSVVHVIGNPAADGGRAAEVLSATLVRLRAEVSEVVDLTTDSVEATTAGLRRAVAEADRLIVVGGDGLVNLATQYLAGTEVALGIVPAGTGNDFARGLGLLEAEDPVGIALGETRRLDALYDDNDGWVASVATIGFSVAVNDRANRLRFPRGTHRYTLATLLELPVMQTQRLRLDVDDERHEVEAAIVAVANTPFFGGGMAICPDARPDDGLLNITVIGAVGRIRLLRTFPKVYDGDHTADPRVRTFSGRRVSIESLGQRGVEVWGDGEPLTTLPTMIEVVPGALRVALPDHPA